MAELTGKDIFNYGVKKVRDELDRLVESDKRIALPHDKSAEKLGVALIDIAQKIKELTQ